MTLQTVKAQVGVRELHDHLSRYVQHVADGNEVLVTMRGRPVARMMPVDARDPFDDLRARGILQEPAGEWVPRRDRPVPRGSVSDLVLEQRRR